MDSDRKPHNPNSFDFAHRSYLLFLVGPLQGNINTIGVGARAEGQPFPEISCMHLRLDLGKNGLLCWRTASGQLKKITKAGKRASAIIGNPAAALPREGKGPEGWDLRIWPYYNPGLLVQSFLLHYRETHDYNKHLRLKAGWWRGGCHLTWVKGRRYRQSRGAVDPAS